MKTKSPREILLEAVRRKIRLTPSNDGFLTFEFVTKPDAAFVELMRRHKPALLALLTGQRHLAVQVLAGEFVGCKLRTFRRVHRELAENPFDPLVHGALRYLKISRNKLPLPSNDF